MLRLINRARRAIPALIMALLLLSSCKAVVPSPPSTPTPLPPEPENRQPVINYMISEQQAFPSSSSRITCVATDADGDTLTYAWSSDMGTIAGTGDTVTWNAPDAPGTYTINVMVTDGKGAEVKDTVTIAVTVKPNRAPTATLIVTRKNQPPVTITPETETITVKRWSSTEIVCQAEDPDGDPLTYKWSATEGKVEGEGNKVYYIATESGDYAITVTVIDTRGASAKTSAYFHVPCCGAGG